MKEEEGGGGVRRGREAERGRREESPYTKKSICMYIYIYIYIWVCDIEKKLYLNIVWEFFDNDNYSIFCRVCYCADM